MARTGYDQQEEESETNAAEGIKDRLDADTVDNVNQKGQTQQEGNTLEPKNGSTPPRRTGCLRRVLYRVMVWRGPDNMFFGTNQCIFTSQSEQYLGQLESD